MIVCFLSISDSTVTNADFLSQYFLGVSVPPDLCLPCRRQLREEIPHVVLIQQERKVKFWKMSDKAKDLRAVELSCL